MPRQSIPQLPQLLARKLYKTGQTRGADDDVIYQNRVSRNSTVLIPFQYIEESFSGMNGDAFENDFICLIPPSIYFNQSREDKEKVSKYNLKLSENMLVFYEVRSDWDNLPIEENWKPATSRTGNLNGEYVARIPANTSSANGSKISHGYNTTGMKGAGIRVFEYANTETIENTRIQLEAIFWMCSDSITVLNQFEMGIHDAEARKEHILANARNLGLLDIERMQTARLISQDSVAQCPLCLESISASGFVSRMEQAAGREVNDITVTPINLFHINELRVGVYNHRPYNLGWGHHHCNVVCKDSGIIPTLQWMRDVVDRNEGLF